MSRYGASMSVQYPSSTWKTPPLPTTAGSGTNYMQLYFIILKDSWRCCHEFLSISIRLHEAQDVRKGVQSSRNVSFRLHHFASFHVILNRWELPLSVSRRHQGELKSAPSDGTCAFISYADMNKLDSLKCEVTGLEPFERKFKESLRH